MEPLPDAARARLDADRHPAAAPDPRLPAAVGRHVGLADRRRDLPGRDRARGLQHLRQAVVAGAGGPRVDGADGAGAALLRCAERPAGAAPAADRRRRRALSGDRLDGRPRADGRGRAVAPGGAGGRVRHRRGDLLPGVLLPRAGARRRRASDRGELARAVHAAVRADDAGAGDRRVPRAGLRRRLRVPCRRRHVRVLRRDGEPDPRARAAAARGRGHLRHAGPRGGDPVRPPAPVAAGGDAGRDREPALLLGTRSRCWCPSS